HFPIRLADAANPALLSARGEAGYTAGCYHARPGAGECPAFWAAAAHSDRAGPADATYPPVAECAKKWVARSRAGPRRPCRSAALALPKIFEILKAQAFSDQRSAFSFCSSAFSSVARGASRS